MNAALFVGIVLTAAFVAAARPWHKGWWHAFRVNTQPKDRGL